MTARAARGGTTLALGAGLVALVLAFLLIGRDRDANVSSAPPVDGAARVEAAGRPNVEGSGDGRPTAPDGAAWLSSATDAIGAQRAALIAQLRASRDATDAMRLYGLLDDCLDYRQHRSTDAAACEGVSGEALAARMDALQRAVEGHAPGAVARLYEAGPDGDFQHDPGNRQRDAWRARLEPLLADAIRHGDITALGAGMLEYDIGIDFPRDPVRALTYVTVAMNVERERGRDISGLALQAARLSSEITSQQRTVAVAEAKRLFEEGYRGKPSQ